MKNLIIRDLQEADFPEIFRLRYKTGACPMFESEYTPDQHEHNIYIKQHIAEYTVSESGGAGSKLIGYCRMKFTGREMASETNFHVFEPSIIIDEKFQGKGIGKRLLKKSEERVINKTKEACLIKMKAYFENKASINLFLSSSYDQYNQNREDFFYAYKIVAHY